MKENAGSIINDLDVDPLNLLFRIFASEKGIEVDCKIEETLCGAVETKEARFLVVALRASDVSPVNIKLSVGILVCACC
jgi:hypothetical protein